MGAFREDIAVSVPTRTFNLATALDASPSIWLVPEALGVNESGLQEDDGSS